MSPTIQMQVIHWPDGGYSFVGTRHTLEDYPQVITESTSRVIGYVCDLCELPLAECDTL